MKLAHAFIIAPFIIGMAACSSLPNQQADLDAVIQASGMAAQLDRLKTPLQVNEKMEGPLGLIPDEWIELVNSTISESLKADAIEKNLKNQLQQNLKGNELNTVQKFYESPVGLRVVQIESGKVPRSSAYNNSSTLDALAEATGAGKAASLLAQNGLNEAIDVAVKNGCFGLSEIPMAGLLIGVVKKAQIKALRSGVTETVRQQYAALSDKEQKDYLAFAQSTAGQKFLQARASVMNDAATQAGNSLSGELGNKVKEVCGKRG